MARKFSRDEMQLLATLRYSINSSLDQPQPPTDKKK